MSNPESLAGRESTYGPVSVSENAAAQLGDTLLHVDTINHYNLQQFLLVGEVPSQATAVLALRSRGCLQRGRLPRLETDDTYLHESGSGRRDQAIRGRGSRSRSRAGSHHHNGSKHSPGSSTSRTPSSSRSYSPSTTRTSSSSCSTRIPIPKSQPQARRYSSLSRDDHLKDSDGLCDPGFVQMSATPDQSQTAHNFDPVIDKRLSERQNNDTVLHDGPQPAAPVKNALRFDNTYKPPCHETEAFLSGIPAHPEINSRRHISPDRNGRNSTLLELVRHLETAVQDLRWYLLQHAADGFGFGHSDKEDEHA